MHLPHQWLGGGGDTASLFVLVSPTLGLEYVWKMEALQH